MFTRFVANSGACFGSPLTNGSKGRETREGHRQSDIGSVSEAMLGKLLRERVECIWAFPSA